MFGIGIFGTAVLTIMTPPAARLSPYGLVALRVFEGIFEVSIINIILEWTTCLYNQLLAV